MLPCRPFPVENGKLFAYGFRHNVLHPTEEAVKKEPRADRVLDVRGWSCPWCVLKAKSWLRRLKPGEVLEVLSTDAEFVKNFRSVLRQSSHQVIWTENHPKHHRLFVRRGLPEIKDTKSKHSLISIREKKYEGE